MKPDLARWLADGRELLEHAHGPGEMPVEVTIRRGGASVAFTLEAEPRAEGTPVIALSPFEQEVVSVISQAPGGVATAKVIARKMGRTPDGRFRVLLTNLAERKPPVLDSTKMGYRVSVPVARESLP